jgi:hypothetical protein
MYKFARFFFFGFLLCYVTLHLSFLGFSILANIGHNWGLN